MYTFVFCILDVLSKNIERSWSIFSEFLSSSLIVLNFIPKCLIHSLLVFVADKKCDFSFILLLNMYLTLTTWFVTNAIFFFNNCSYHLWLQIHSVTFRIFILLICFVIFSVLCHHQDWLEYFGLVVYFEVRKCVLPALLFKF